MKRIGMSLCLISLFFAINVNADTYQDYEYSIQNSSVTITKYTGSGTEAIIPEAIEGYPVTAIGDWAFSGGVSLTSIIIPDSITSIGNDAFFECVNMTSIIIPENVTSIGNEAFFACPRLLSIEVDADNTAYASQDGVLFNKDLTQLICFPSGRTGDYAIPGSVINVGYGSFDSSNLTSIVIPDGVTSIGDYVFGDSGKLKSVTIPESVAKIDNWAFSNCSQLLDVWYAGTDIQWEKIEKGEYWKDGCPENMKVHFKWEDVAIDANHFPDKEFRKYVLENIDTNGDGILSKDEAEQTVDINVMAKSI